MVISGNDTAASPEPESFAVTTHVREPGCIICRQNDQHGEYAEGEREREGERGGVNGNFSWMASATFIVASCYGFPTGS